MFHTFPLFVNEETVVRRIFVWRYNVNREVSIFKDRQFCPILSNGFYLKTIFVKPDHTVTQFHILICLIFAQNLKLFKTTLTVYTFTDLLDGDVSAYRIIHHFYI